MSSANTLLFLRPILTPNALATVQANPILLGYMGLAIFGITLIISIAGYTSWVTSKPYKKPKQKKGGAAGGGRAKGGPSAGGAGVGAKAGNMLKGLRGRIGL
jgi:hypothetical protein